MLPPSPTIPGLHVVPIGDRDLDRLAEPWNRLAGGMPFRRWEWLATWWRHYAPGRRLCTLAVYDGLGKLVGLAPWCLERSLAQGRVLRFLGSGEVCSDYLSLLCEAGLEDEVARAVADYLCGTLGNDRTTCRWDLLELTGVDAEDPLVPRLADRLEERGCVVHRAAGPCCWRLEFPSTWEAYEAQLSKSHRKQVRRMHERVLATGRAVLHTVRDETELMRGWPILVDLHQRRRQSLGEPGCFASAQFAAFHRDAASRLLAAGALRLHWIELDGRPVAAEYHVAGQNVVYGYQSGVSPEALDEEPGRLAALATLRRSLEEGYIAFDFLRGDEPYKAHWRGTPRPSLELRIAAPRRAARVRQRTWLAGQRVKRWAKSGLGD
jgi:CelD/BcsL family acetyltransferase involved in cellulose biosynthesis